MSSVTSVTTGTNSGESGIWQAILQIKKLPTHHTQQKTVYKIVTLATCVQHGHFLTIVSMNYFKLYVTYYTFF